jgi:peptidoglycan/LPS O-acetylase OafA/YrhL
MRRIPPFARGLLIIALIAGAIVVLDQEAALTTASALLRFAFYLAIAFVGYLLWRDFGRREITLWPRRQQIVFYGAVGLLLVDLGWYFATPLDGRDLLAFFVVAAAAVYAGVHTWRDQHRYS